MNQAYIVGIGSVGSALYSVLHDRGVQIQGIIGSKGKGRGHPFFISNNSHEQNRIYCPSVVGFDCLKNISPDVPIFLTTKTYSLDETLLEMRPFLRDDQIIIACQNGLRIREKVRDTIPNQRVLRGLLWCGLTLEPSTEIPSTWRLRINSGDPKIVICTDENHKEEALLKSLFYGSTIRLELSTDTKQEEWKKALGNITSNSLCALTQTCSSSTIVDPAISFIAMKIRAEAISVAREDGVEFSDSFIKELNSITASMTNHRPSTAQDLDSGRTTEIDALNGTVVALGKSYCVPTPYNQLLCDLIRQAEQNHFHATAPNAIQIFQTLSQF